MYVPSKLLRLVIIFLLIFSVPEFSFAVNVKDFGAKADGKTDDSHAINKAILACTDGVIEFPRGNYKITRTIFIDLSKNGTLGISGKGGSASVIMAGEGPALDNSANVQVVNCIISEDSSNPRMLASIALKGSCAGAMIRNNNISVGKNGAITNNATGAIIEDNIHTGRNGVSEKK